MFPRLISCCAVVAVAGSVAVTGSSQTPPLPPPPVQANETMLVAQAAAALAQNNPALASSLAAAALQQFPRSIAPLPIYVQAEIVRGGAAGGLAAYEQWLGARRVDNPHVLRYVAMAALREAAMNRTASDARFEAVTALAAEGDPQTLLDLVNSVQNASQANVGDVEILARLGNAEATRRLIAQIKDPAAPANKARLIGSLAATRNPLVIPPLIEFLSDSNLDNRAAAAAALGGLEATQATDKLRTLLNDPFPVKFQAAGALLKLHDNSGLSFLRDLEVNGQQMIKVDALEMTSVQPDAAWRSNVKNLLQDRDPMIRLKAAQLLAPYEPELARATLDSLRSDGNLAIRGEAAKVYVTDVATDFAGLRQFLRDTGIARVRASARILELTR